MEYELDIEYANESFELEVEMAAPAFDLEIELNNIFNLMGGGSDTTIEVVAQENILAFQPVTANGYVADSNTDAHRNKVIGLAKANINTGFSGNVETDAEVTNPAWTWNVGDIIFINGAGVLSTTAPDAGWCQIIGIAVASDSISLEIQEAIRM